MALSDITFDFMRYRTIAGRISAGLVLLSAISLAINQVEWGLGFTRSEAARRFLRMLDREHRNPFTGRQDSTVRTLIRALRVWLREEQSARDEGQEYE